MTTTSTKSIAEYSAIASGNEGAINSKNATFA